MLKDSVVFCIPSPVIKTKAFSDLNRLRDASKGDSFRRSKNVLASFL